MLVLGFLGPCGTHSEEAAMYINKVCGGKWQLQPYQNIYETIYAVHEGKIAACLVPIENSIEGTVRITLDTLAHDVDLKINMELVWKIQHQLLAKNNKRDFNKIISHPQALAQCYKYIKKNYPCAKLIEAPSTADAAATAAVNEKTAAIASKRAGKLYRLNIIADNIQDVNNNVTRFVLLNKEQIDYAKGNTGKILLICQIDGAKAGSLCEVLMIFAKYNINMTHIESRPARTKLGNYIFFFEIETDMAGEKYLSEALQKIKQKCLWVKNLGTFSVLK
ncbi:prephenate dehydratase [Pectinatus sottacetonis]|uniref:prephenate dehydratase n=1 Tax=Pectinatus sottacetonis TaxID=1002795 RepID=UPI0018C45D33|nr:prephenate dehydratase [Pectinatus sottacetonis]